MKRFDTSRLVLKPIAERTHDMNISAVMELSRVGISEEFVERLTPTAAGLVEAKRAGTARIMMMGAHVLRSGVQRYIIDLMRRGYISLIAMNGAGMIHDYELALIGATTESVARYIKTGEFGFWKETGYINDVAAQAFQNDRSPGLGEAMGAHITDEKLPHSELSLLGCAFRLGIPVTIHVAFGQDIIHQHPNFDPAVTGALTYNDFLAFAGEMESLEHGVLMNFGSAVMGPEVYLKALSMCRNVAEQAGKSITRFTVLVCDLRPLPDDYSCEPEKTRSEYYFRPWKTMLVRTTAEGGRSHYVQGAHAWTVPALWEAINRIE